jgi:hypothetical protein
VAKRKVESQINIFTPNHSNSRIALIYLCAGGMPHIIGKLSTKVTTLLKTSSQLKVYRKSYGSPKSWESQFWEFRDSNLGVPEQNDIWVLALWLGTKNIIRGKVVASPNFGS